MATINVTVTIAHGEDTAQGQLALDLPGLSVTPPEPPPPPPPPDPDVNPGAPPPPPRPDVAPGSTGRVLTVGRGQGQGYTTVAAAMAAAQNGDTIRLQSNANRESFVVNKNVLVDGGGVSWDFSDMRLNDLA